MTHRLAQFLLSVLFMSACFLIAPPLGAQDSPQPATTKSSTPKSKTTASSESSEESAKDESNAAKIAGSDKTEPARTDAVKTDGGKEEDTKKNEDPQPTVESPKLIQVPQDGTTYTPRPKVTAVFVFTNGDRIESDDYLITKDALFINRDGRKTRYPINTVDRDATKAANQGRGVDIVFPKSKSEFNLDF
jgi:hypothetical protein